MMATVFRKVKLGNKNKSEMTSYECENESENLRAGRRTDFGREPGPPCSRVCGLVNVCARPADSIGNCRRRNRPRTRRRTGSHLTLFRSLQLRIDLWTSTTGHFLDGSFARRFCGRKCDNELYRSNSFRFEKFERQEGDPQQQSKLSIPQKPSMTEGNPKPTKYHYYPHNQHIYLLPECAIQQVCNAVYVRLNYTQPLCACPSRKEPCSASLNADDMHTTELVTASTGKVLTLVKTCEPVAEMRICRAPRDWSLLALQNVRTGKSHYLVICRCPHKGRLEGPMSHDQPAYASVPGIRVYGMMCVRDSYRISRPFRYRRSLRDRKPDFPWNKLKEFQSSVQW